ncbi:carbamate kinase [Escherichia coli]|nr:carbamate kinase [Escherichia coli]
MIRRFCSQRNLLVRFISQKNKRHWKRLTGWQMKRDGKYLRRVVASPQPRKILDSEAIELLLQRGHVVICSGGGGVPVTEDGAGSEAVMIKISLLRCSLSRLTPMGW